MIQINNLENSSHIQISGYYCEDSQLTITGRYLKTVCDGKPVLDFELIVSSLDYKVVQYILNPSFEEIEALEEKYIGVSNELFKNIFIGLCTQCFWGDEEIDKLRAKPLVVGLKGINELIKHFEKEFKSWGTEKSYDLIYSIKDRMATNNTL